jgi:hypothetical protein
METTVEIPPPPAEQTDLYLVFNVTRGKPTGIRAGIPGVEHVPPGTESFPPNTLHLRLTTKAVPARLPVTTRGEPVELARAIYLDRERQKARVYTRNRKGKFGRPVVLSGARAQDLRGQVLDAAKYRLEMERALAVLDSKGTARSARFHQYCQYFWELDRETHDDLVDSTIPTAGLAESRHYDVTYGVETLRNLLRERAACRRDQIAANQPQMAQTSRPSNVDDLRTLRRLSDLQLRILTKHFPLESPTRLQDIEDAYERFANGELGLYLESGEWACEPSSGYFFLFAEFALLAADPALAEVFGGDQVTWQGLCGVLVRVQELYCRVYKPSGNGPFDFSSYSAENYYGNRELSRGEVRDLRKKYAGLGLDRLRECAGDNVLAHLPGVLA